MITVILTLSQGAPDIRDNLKNVLTPFICSIHSINDECYNTYMEVNVFSPRSLTYSLHNACVQFTTEIESVMNEHFREFNPLRQA